MFISSPVNFAIVALDTYKETPNLITTSTFFNASEKYPTYLSSDQWTDNLSSVYIMASRIIVMLSNN